MQGETLLLNKWFHLATAVELPQGISTPKLPEGAEGGKGVAKLQKDTASSTVGS